MFIFWKLSGNFAMFPYRKIPKLSGNIADISNPISYRGRVIANVVFKHLCYGHISLKAILPYCKSRP